MQFLPKISSGNYIRLCLNMHRVVLLCMFFTVIKGNTPDMPASDEITQFQPSLAVVVGVLAVMFILTFILLFFAKCCNQQSPVQNQGTEGRLALSRSGYSGIDKTVIESLPFFRFSALKGSREGLECAVCLSKFQDIEILRLLPKCKHAFHINCVDQWLERHSSCPLCRHKVSSEDHASVTYSDSLRFLQSQSDLRQDSTLELFVQREGDNNQHKSSRFIRGDSFRNSTQNEGKMPVQETCVVEEILHKFNHKIIVADGVLLKNRWSSISSSDLMFLNSEMINEASTNIFSSKEVIRNDPFTISTEESSDIMMIKEEMERKSNFENKLGKDRQDDTIPIARVQKHSSKILEPNEKRSMSEIIIHPRSARSIASGESYGSQNNVNEEKQRRLWLPIARRTVEWFANKERRFTHSHQNTIQSHV